MRTQIRKWGNSLAVRIPKPFAEASRLEDGSEVDLSSFEDRLVLQPVQRPRYELDELLEGVTEENLHAEVDLGSAVGQEYW